MRTLTLLAQDERPVALVIRTGLAFAVTVSVFYALCTVVWVIAQPQFLGFMNSLFHGIDFTPLVTDGGFSWGSFLAAVAVLGVWSFAAGCFFSWLRQRLGG